jgi:hypothetical protein
VPKALAIPCSLSRSATQLTEIMAKVDRPGEFRRQAAERDPAKLRACAITEGVEARPYGRPMF